MTLAGDQTSETARGVRLEQYAPELYRFLLGRLRNRQEAEDLLQSVYVRFLQTSHMELVRQPRAYLYRIAVNMIGEFKLRLQRSPVLYDSEAVSRRADHMADAAENDAANLELEEKLRQIVDGLPSAYRTVLLLRAFDRLSFKEIGAQLGITEQSARKYLVRAMALCRAADWTQGHRQ